MNYKRRIDERDIAKSSSFFSLHDPFLTPFKRIAYFSHTYIQVGTSWSNNVGTTLLQRYQR